MAFRLKPPHFRSAARVRKARVVARGSVLAAAREARLQRRLAAEVPAGPRSPGSLTRSDPCRRVALTTWKLRSCSRNPTDLPDLLRLVSNEDSMNTFLIATLVVSGAIELLVGLGALSGSFGASVPGLTKLLGTEQIAGPGLLLLFLVGLGSLALAALHVLAIRWVRTEKPEGHHLAIALGAAATVVGLGAFIHSQSAAVPLLIVDTLRGLVVGIAGIAAMNAPSVIRDLRIPARREAERGSARRALPNDARRGTRRDRDSERRRGGRGERGERGSGRRGGPDSERVGAPRARRESPDGGARAGRPDLRERRDRRAPAPAAPDSVDSRDLSVVVSGRPPVKATPPAASDRPQPRPEPPRDAEDRVQMPRAPMVPRVRAEIPPIRPLRDDEEPPRGGEMRRSEDGQDRVSRKRRRRSGSRSSRGDDRVRPLPDRSEPMSDSGEEEIAPHRARGEYRPEPGREPRSEPRPEPRPEPRFEPSRDEYAATESRSSHPEPHPQPAQPPIDRISAFSREGEGGDEPRAATPPEFGRTRRPFSQHRKGRQVKPRENRVHRTLGGDLERGDAEEPKEKETRRVAPEGRIGMADGIGPIDLTDREPPTDD